MLCRYTAAEFKGKEVYLAYTVNAMFRINDLLEEGEQIMELIDGKGDGGFRRFCRAVSILAVCGAQARESEGFPRSCVPQESELYECMQPVEYMKLKKEAINAILLGYGREVTDAEEEVDLELAEMEKNKTHQGFHIEHGGPGGFLCVRSSAVRAGPCV